MIEMTLTQVVTCVGIVVMIILAIITGVRERMKGDKESTNTLIETCSKNKMKIMNGLKSHIEGVDKTAKERTDRCEQETERRFSEIKTLHRGHQHQMDNLLEKFNAIHIENRVMIELAKILNPDQFEEAKKKAKESDDLDKPSSIFT